MNLWNLFSFIIGTFNRQYYNLYNEYLLFWNELLYGDNLYDRMRYKLEHYNYGSFNKDRIYVISVKSKKLLKFLNEKTPTYMQKIREFDEYNKIINTVCRACYDAFDPLMIYAFNDEYHLVFDERDLQHPLYNGNINKKITLVTSFITHHLTKELLKQDIELELTMSAKWLSFKDDYESLNYILYRQKDCLRNNLRLLFEYFEDNIMNLSLEQVILKFMNFDESKVIKDDVLYGSIFKKNEEKEVVVFNENISDNFKFYLQKFIYSKYV